MRTEDHTPRSRSRAGRSGRTATIAAVLTVGGIAAANWAISGSGSGTTSTTARTDDRTQPAPSPAGPSRTPQARTPQTPNRPSRSGRLAGRTATIAAVAAVLTVGGIATANWAISGSGSGAAEATTVSNLTVAVSTDDVLYPGVTRSGTLTVTNPNDFPVEITAVTFNGAVSIIGGPGTCTAANSEVTFADAASLTISVPANATNQAFAAALPNAITMGNTADSGCQGLEFTRAFDVTAAIETP